MVIPEIDLEPLEELFPANVFRKKRKINDEGTMTIKDKFGTKSEKRLHFSLIFGLMIMIKTLNNKKIAIFMKV